MSKNTHKHNQNQHVQCPKCKLWTAKMNAGWGEKKQFIECYSCDEVYIKEWSGEFRILDRKK